MMCDRSADGGTSADQAEGGGSIPARSLYFHLGLSDEARALVMAHHYSRRWPAGVACVGTFHIAGGLFGTIGPAVAACVFGQPAARWSCPVVELTRLVRTPDAKVPLSKLVAMTRKRCPAPLAVSFADRTQGHEGYVYQACGWNYAGCRERRMDGVVWQGQFVPGRSANAMWGTRSPTRLAERGIGVEPHYDEGKHLYWHANGDEGKRWAAELNLQSAIYPKGATR